MSHGGGEESLMSCLPPEVLSLIFSYCDTTTVGKLALVCRKFYDIVTQDCMWIRRSKNLLVSNQEAEGIKNRSCQSLTAWHKCRLSYNWKKAYYQQQSLIEQRTKYMPWLQLSSDKLWYSKGNVIQCFARYSSGFIKKKPRYTLKGHVDDVCRFVHRRNLIISGGRDGCVCGWSADSGEFLFFKRRCHTTDVNSVDAADNIVISGSKDKTVQVWSLQKQTLVQQYAFNVQDRVWTVAISPNINKFAVGSAGCHNTTPLQLYDLESGSLLMILGNQYRKGAGVLDLCYESPHVLLAGGYDTFIRMWDLRSGNCVLKWEDPHDSVIYCLATDEKFTILSGTALHGLVRLWDKRSTKSVQMYYVGQGNSPVYSLAFDPCHMYVALDSSMHLLNFSDPPRGMVFNGFSSSNRWRSPSNDMMT